LLFDTETGPLPAYATPRHRPAPPRIDAFLLLLLLFPLLLLVISSNWIFTPDGYVDPWVYYGYFRDLVALKNDTILGGHYYGSRLSWLLPGFVVHRFLNPVNASVVLHLSVYYVAVFSLYGTLRRTVGRRGALTASLLLGGYAYFLTATGWDYVDGAGVAYCLLALACITKAAAGASPRLACLAAGAAAAAMVHANLVCLALCPLLALYWWALLRIRAGSGAPPALADSPLRPAASALGWSLAGAALLTVLLCVINYSICGTWLFFLPSLRFAMQSAASANPWAVSAASWLPRATWLVLPLAVFVAVTGALLSARRQRCPWTYPTAFGALFAVASLMWLALESTGSPVLQLPYYASYLLPWLFLALGAALSPLLETLSAAGFAVVVLVCGVVFPLPLWGASVAGQFAAQFGLWLPLGMGALLAAALLLRLPKRVALALALFALCACHATLVPSSYTFSDRHLARESFVRITAAAETVRDRAGRADFLFWYDREEPGFREFLSLNSIFIWGRRTLGMAFPALPKNLSLQPGTVLVIPSERADAAAQARLQLEARGFQARVFHEPVTVPGASYRIHFLKLETAPEPTP
jgi:hypothetical protein